LYDIRTWQIQCNTGFLPSCYRCCGARVCGSVDTWGRSPWKEILLLSVASKKVFLFLGNRTLEFSPQPVSHSFVKPIRRFCRLPHFYRPGPRPHRGIFLVSPFQNHLPTPWKFVGPILY